MALSDLICSVCFYLYPSKKHSSSSTMLFFPQQILSFDGKPHEDKNHTALMSIKIPVEVCTQLIP